MAGSSTASTMKREAIRRHIDVHHVPEVDLHGLDKADW